MKHLVAEYHNIPASVWEAISPRDDVGTIGHMLNNVIANNSHVVIPNAERVVEDVGVNLLSSNVATEIISLGNAAQGVVDVAALVEHVNERMKY